MELIWHNAQMEQPTDPDAEVLVKVLRPFSQYTVAKFMSGQWWQYLIPIDDPGLKFQGGWIGFDRSVVILEWAYICKK